MASTAELLLRASGATLWLPLPSHSAPYPSSCSEDLGDLLDQLEEIELDHHSKPPRMVTGKDYTKSEAVDIEIEYMDRYCERMGVYLAMRDAIIAPEDYDTPFPPFPLKVLPPATSACFVDGCCYHSVYKTHDTSTNHNVCYSSSLCVCQALEPSYPTSVYGIFAVRDDLDKRRNYVFNCPRYAAVGIGKQDSFALPLCSPCRGMYVLDRI
ncbi:hypothetical protein BRADI_1g09290v3 [Brachypodium distachyon]|uniref:DUF6598 domain-containing protein n=1 Tax=Brachypodium distachyon TaxID=15368 RepID=A0A0Q3GSD6_BRADI|nr:hypothetical protein BRADI_1g09290v3 [Brachypodium distachyon]